MQPQAGCHGSWWIIHTTAHAAVVILLSQRQVCLHGHHPVRATLSWAGPQSQRSTGSTQAVHGQLQAVHRQYTGSTQLAADTCCLEAVHRCLVALESSARMATAIIASMTLLCLGGGGSRSRDNSRHSDNYSISTSTTACLPSG